VGEEVKKRERADIAVSSPPCNSPGEGKRRVKKKPPLASPSTHLQGGSGQETRGGKKKNGCSKKSIGDVQSERGGGLLQPRARGKNPQKISIVLLTNPRANAGGQEQKREENQGSGLPSGVFTDRVTKAEK